jgi:hypothetical protein
MLLVQYSCNMHMITRSASNPDNAKNTNSCNDGINPHHHHHHHQQQQQQQQQQLIIIRY